jgi:hypothetical protein
MLFHRKKLFEIISFWSKILNLYLLPPYTDATCVGPEHTGTMEVHPGAMEAHLGAMELTLRLQRLTLELWRCNLRIWSSP